MTSQAYVSSVPRRAIAAASEPGGRPLARLLSKRGPCVSEPRNDVSVPQVKARAEAQESCRSDVVFRCRIECLIEQALLDPAVTGQRPEQLKQDISALDARWDLGSSSWSNEPPTQVAGEPVVVRSAQDASATRG